MNLLVSTSNLPTTTMKSSNSRASAFLPALLLLNLVLCSSALPGDRTPMRGRTGYARRLLHQVSSTSELVTVDVKASKASSAAAWVNGSAAMDQSLNNMPPSNFNPVQN